MIKKTDANEQYLPFSHLIIKVPHTETFLEKSALTRVQEIDLGIKRN